MSARGRDQSILIAEPDPIIASQITSFLREWKIINPVQCVSSVEETVAYVRGDRHFKNRAQFPAACLVLLALKFKDGCGLQIVSWLNQTSPPLCRIIILAE